MALFRNKASSAALLADVRIPRTKFHEPYGIKTTMNAGDLIPVFWEEMIPGQNRSLNPSKLIRSLTPIVPVMDNAFADLDFFFVPMRLVWEDWQAFQGENPDAPWYNDTVYQIPSIPAGTELTDSLDPNGLGRQYTLWDYFGLPTVNNSLGSYVNTAAPVSILRFRAYGLIWNEFYRNQNISDPLLIQKGPYVPEIPDSPDAFVQTSDGLMYTYPLQSARYHDMFSDALPAPQKGPDVMIPGLGSSLPVTTGPAHVNDVSSGAIPMTFTNTATGADVTTSGSMALNSTGGSGYTAGTTANASITPDNLLVDSAALSGATISALRTAFQIQKILERDTYGTRYTEILRNHFGVVSPDARLQRPEYLGGCRVSLNVSQVVQTSSTDSTSPQGNTAAYSKTVDSNFAFDKGLLEHGYIIGLLTIRTERSYQQGIDRSWSRQTRYDFFMPELSLISNQPVYRSEIFGYSDDSTPPTGSSAPIFGYREAWDEYRRHTNIVTGAFRSGVADSLDIWHYADYYTTPPSLSPAWMLENESNVNRTLAVQASRQIHNQFLVDLYFEGTSTLPMPATSQPGLVDHF